MMDSEQMQLKYKPIKVCGICGDKALGYNFNAITCEACKAFFRRNALRNKDFKCPFDGNCKIDLVTRRFCQKCRLKKCFDIGMKKEWILSDEEKKVKRDKIIENRRKKDSPSQNGNDYDQYGKSGDESSPEHKPSPSCLNSDIMNSSYQLSAYSKNIELFNSLYLFEPYHHSQYQNYLSNKGFFNKDLFSKESTDSYSSSLPNKHFNFNSTSNENISPKNIPALQPASSIVNHHNNNSMWSMENSNDCSKSTDSFKSPPMNCYEQSPNNQQAPFKLHKSQPFTAEKHIQNVADKNNYEMIHTQEKADLDAGVNNYDMPLVGCSKLAGHLSPIISSDESENTYNSYYADKSIDDVLGSPNLPPNTTLIDPNLKMANNNHIYAKENDKNGYLHLHNNEDLKHKKQQTYCLYENSHKVSDNEDYKLEKSTSLPTEKPKFTTPDNPLLPDACKSTKTFSFVENLRLQELVVACERIKLWCHYDNICHELSDLNGIYQVVDVVIKHCISMANMISSFTVLCPVDQIALLKGSVTEMMILLSVLNYVPSKDAWIFNLSQKGNQATLLKYTTYKKVVSKEEYIEEFRTFLLSFPEQWKKDQTLFDLLLAVILFNPNHLNLKHDDIIKLESLTYHQLLKKYLEINYSLPNTTKILPNLLHLIEQLHRINNKIKKSHALKIIDGYNATFHR